MFSSLGLRAAGAALAVKSSQSAGVAAISPRLLLVVTGGVLGGVAVSWTNCDDGDADNNINNAADSDSRTTMKVTTPSSLLLLQKRTTLLQAVQRPPPATPPLRSPVQSRSTALEDIRANQSAVLQKWERDEEEHWRELPARAWPAVQPNPDESLGIQRLYDAANCAADHNHSTSDSNVQQCREWDFQMATTLVFYSVDPARGLQRFRQLAQQGHVDALVACGIILVEGLGVPPDEHAGLQYLEQALERGSSQAAYELGTIYYTGLDGLVEEDEAKAFRLFANAASHHHTAALFMMADCLFHGEGTERDVPRAIPLFYQAAEQGHRFARQRIREFLATYGNGQVD
jgi:Sel1 repeat